jgi:MoxR-like ATPase
MANENERAAARPAGKDDVAWFQQQIGRLREEIGKVIVGNREVVDGALTCMLVGSHALLEGVPGLGKTLLVRTLAEALSLNFSRVQFTPDLMPADILGTTMINEDGSGKKVFEFRKGPIFANIVLADEINRATPKTQSALLEAMQEHSVTVARTTHKLEEPFLVLATQNPLESEGTYPLPEAQLDRFFFKLHVPFPNHAELHSILDRTTGEATATVEPVLQRDEILRMQRLVREVPAARHVQDYTVRLLQATHPDGPGAPDMVKKYVRFGSSPRGAQAVLLAAKIRALFEGRFAASLDDVRASAKPALRHRVLLNFEGEAEGIKTDQVLEQVIKSLPEEGKK